MNNDKYISPIKIYKQYNITSGTLRNWAETEKIRFLRPNNTGRRIYNIDDIEKILGIETEPKIKKTVCYARVNSNYQKEDFDKQILLFNTEFPGVEIITDIGSGLDWGRKGFNSLLDRIYTGEIDQVVVSCKYRLCSLGNESVEWIFKKHNVKLLIIDKDSKDKHISRELSDDLFEITTILVARNNCLKTSARDKDKDKEINNSIA